MWLVGKIMIALASLTHAMYFSKPLAVTLTASLSKHEQNWVQVNCQATAGGGPAMDWQFIKE